MTALNLATDIPSSIVTLEQLAAWCGNCLANLNSNVNAVEGEGYTQRAAQSGTFYIASNDTIRHVTRQSLILNKESLVGPLKDWMYVEELSTKPLTAAMKAN